MKFVAFLLVLSLAGAAEAQKPPLPQGDKYTCKPIDTGYAAEVLLPDGAVAPLGVTALSLELDGKVTVGGVGAPNGPVRMAVIMIKGHDTPAAEYKLDLLAGRNSYSILVTIPPVTLLTLPAKVQIKQTFVPLLGWPCLLTSCELKIPLSPMDPKAPLTRLRASVAEAFLKDGGAAPGSLTVDIAPHAYDPSAPQNGPQLTLRAGDDFQQGESQGKVRVFADQLSPSVTIPVSVLRVPTSLVLIPILIAGLALGYFVRVRMEEQIAKKNALVDAGRFLARVAQELASKEDPSLQEELLVIRKEVEDKSAAKAAALRTALEAAGPKLTKSLTDFETRKSAFVADSEALLQLVLRKFTLPDAFTNVIGSARTALTQIVEVPRNNVAEAKKSLAAAEDLLMVGTQNAARSWDAVWQETKAVVEQLLPLLLTEDHARVQTDFESADATHAKVKDFLLSTAPSRQQLQDALEAVHRNNMLLVPFLFGLPLRLGNAIDRLDLEMKDRNRATDPEWVAWKGLAVRAVESLSTPGAKVADELRVLRENLKATIRSLAGRLEVEALASLREHLEKNEFVPAISLLKPRLQTSESVFRAAEAVRLRPIPPVMSEASAPGTPLSPRSAPVIPGEPELLAQIEQLETWKRVVIGILIVLFGWVVLGVSFKGEPLEYLTAFGWALLTDLTTANLITTFTPLKEKVKVP